MGVVSEEEISEDLLYGEIRPLPPSQEQISLEVRSSCIETFISFDRVKTPLWLYRDSILSLAQENIYLGGRTPLATGISRRKAPPCTDRDNQPILKELADRSSTYVTVDNDRVNVKVQPPGKPRAFSGLVFNEIF